MITGFRLFVNIAPLAAVIMVFSLITVFPYRKEPAAQSLIFFILFVVWLLITNTAEMWAPIGPIMLLFAKLEYLAYVYIPVAWMSFCLRYSGWITYTRKKLLLFAIVGPAGLFLLVLTNEYHGYLWTKIAYFSSEGLSVMRPEHGPLFWFIIAYTWLLMGLGTLIIFRSHFSGQKMYYRQSLWILAGAVMPAVTNTINVFGLIPGLNKDFTPIGFALSGICFLAGIYFHRLLWIMPVARAVILQELPIGILVIDSRGWIVDHNQKVDELFNLDAVSVGRAGHEYAAVRNLYAVAGYTPGTALTGLRSGQMSLKEKTVSWSLQPANHGSKSVIVTVEDISASVSLRDEVSRIKTEFIHREKLASIGQLTAGLAHEINNPLGYLKSDVRSLQVLVERSYRARGETDAGEIITITRGITEGLDRIENVIRSLLSFSRQGKLTSSRESYDLHAGIDTTLDIMHYEYQSVSGIQKQYGDLPLLHAEKNEINQVLFNIFTNALQAIKDRKKREDFVALIKIRTGACGSAVYCEIENNGTPITPEVRDRLFELFFTTKPENWGTGLGLNLSRDIIEHRHHGKLELVSIDPVIFRIELPVESAP